MEAGLMEIEVGLVTLISAYIEFFIVL